jgi:hypothetical protein
VNAFTEPHSDAKVPPYHLRTHMQCDHAEMDRHLQLLREMEALQRAREPAPKGRVNSWHMGPAGKPKA